MKIVFLISHLSPEFIGGAEVQTSRLAERLSEKGHDVLVLTRRWVKSWPYEEKRNGFTIRRFWVITFPVFRFFSHIIFSLNEIRKIRKDIDVLQCIMLTPNGVVGVIANKLWGIRTSAWIRGGDWYFARERWITRFLISYVIMNCELILTQTPKIKAEVLKEYPNAQIKVVQNGIDIHLEKASGNKIIFVGSLSWRKGVEYLIEAMREVEGSLIIVGDGEKKADLVKLSEGMDNIEFVGRVHPDEVKKYLKQGKIFVLPAIAGEGQPNAIMEAMAMGLPIVTTKLAGIPDIVEHGKTGFLVVPKDSQDMARYINLLLKDEGLWSEMRENCKKEVENYSWERVITKLEKAYLSIM